MNVLRQMCSPLKYFAASNSAKRLIDWIVPTVATAGLMLVFAVLPRGISFLGADGIVRGVGDILQDLVGFYIAALAAIATFNVRSLDQIIAGDEPVVLRDTHGNTDRVTRRRLLSLMFSYLSLASLLLYLIGLMAQALRPNLELVAALPFAWLAFGAAKAIYLFLLCQLLAVTMLGLHYLGDRLHRQNAVPLAPKDVEWSSESDPTFPAGVADPQLERKTQSRRGPGKK